MSTFRPEKLSVKFVGAADPEGPISPRKYTLTHSDTTGDLFLSVGTAYDRKAISGIYTRLMRDEVLAEFITGQDGPELHVYCHVSGGIILGGARWRYQIFQQHMQQVLAAMRYGDDVFLAAHPEFDLAPVKVHFRSTRRKYNRIEDWGRMTDYALSEPEVNHEQTS